MVMCSIEVSILIVRLLSSFCVSGADVGRPRKVKRGSNSEVLEFFNLFDDNLGKEISVGNNHKFGFGRISESQFVTLLISDWMAMASQCDRTGFFFNKMSSA